MNVTELLSGFLKKPFDPNGDAVSWILFLGFASLVLFGWHRVVEKIVKEV